MGCIPKHIINSITLLNMKSLSTNQMASLDGGRCNYNLCYKAWMGYYSAMMAGNPLAAMAFLSIMNSRACNTCEFGES